MSKHTQGPWTVHSKEKKKLCSIYIYGPTTNVIAKLIYRVATPPKIQDAYLISAAPDLLDAAKFALISLAAAAECLGDENMYAAARSDLRKAIAKAEGACTSSDKGEEK